MKRDSDQGRPNPARPEPLRGPSTHRGRTGAHASGRRPRGDSALGYRRDLFCRISPVQLRYRPWKGTQVGFLGRRLRSLWEAEATKLFLDTGAFVARYVPDDANHAAAVRTFREIQAGRRPYKLLYTSNFVVDETATRILYERGHRDALLVLGLLRGDPALRTLHVSEQMEEDIDREFARYRDKRISYTDCSTKILMDRQKIETIFSFDENFEAMGLSRIP